MKIKTNYINQKYTLCDFTEINFKGERGDSTPRIAAPQAAALTTWRRPPCAINLPIIFHFEISK